ncbi:hypothetical protein BC628DRAFT_1423814 [Trametes gibbosa]|nr:hypothetical protein BC628DRAFT_1423814 [Trametes gibbosa]
MATPPPQPTSGSTPNQEVMSAFIAALDKLDAHLSARLNRIEAAYGGMAQVAAEALQVANSTRQETKDGLERLHTGTLNAAKCALASTEKIQLVLGDLTEDTDIDRDAEHQGATILGRLRQLERAVIELSESVSDPDAARPTIVRHEAGVNTTSDQRMLVDVEVNAVPPEQFIDRTNTGITVHASVDKAFNPAGSTSNHVSPSGGNQTKYIHFATPARVPLSPFAVQPLIPARWGSATKFGTHDESITSNSNSKAPTPITDARSPVSAERTETPVSIPAATSEGRSSSIFEEEEILNTLGADDHESTSQALLSPPSAPTQTLPLIVPRTPPASTQSSFSASPLKITPIPRRTLIAHSNATSGPSTTVPSVSPPSVNLVTAATAPASQSPKRTIVPIPRRTTLSILRPVGTAASPPTGASTSAVAESAVPVSVTTSTSTQALSPTRVPQRIRVPLPRGYGKPFPKSFSPLSSVSQSRRAWASSDSDSLSSLSSLSTPPHSRIQPHAETQSQAPTRTSARLQASASSASATGSRSTSVVPFREGSTRATGGNRSAPRGGGTTGAATSASARVAVKKERSDAGVAGRPAKRRKTDGGGLASQVQDDDAGMDDGASGTSFARGGKGRARVGRVGAKGRGRSRGGAPAILGKSSIGSAQPTTPGIKTGGAEKGKAKKYEPPQVGTKCAWPSKIDGDDAYQREFVQCDNCEAWYHFGCVGMEADDPRLEPEAEFLVDIFVLVPHSAIREQRQGLRFQEAACARPDCERAGLAEDTNEYFVERIIGRRPYDADLAEGIKRPTRFLWLVKWDGWKAESASWQERGHLGDCARFIEEFEQAAEIEGRNLAQLDKVVVLNEGLAAGW